MVNGHLAQWLVVAGYYFSVSGISDSGGTGGPNSASDYPLPFFWCDPYSRIRLEAVLAQYWRCPVGSIVDRVFIKENSHLPLGHVIAYNALARQLVRGAKLLRQLSDLTVYYEVVEYDEDDEPEQAQE